MSVTIKKNDTPEEIEKKMAEVIAALKKDQSTFHADKYLGKLKGLYGDPLTYQKQLRDEWER